VDGSGSGDRFVVIGRLSSQLRIYPQLIFVPSLEVGHFVALRFVQKMPNI
jgi:hypothetical protein